MTVKTNKNSYKCRNLVLTVGPWASKILPPLGVNIPLKVRLPALLFHDKYGKFAHIVHLQTDTLATYILVREILSFFALYNLSLYLSRHHS